MSNIYQSNLINMKHKYCFFVVSLVALLFLLPVTLDAQSKNSDADLDKKVTEFLQKNRNRWYDMNIPEADGKKMYDIIIENGYRNALEIGTSTGHSGIWIAWALSKTGGKLVTIEIDRERHETALRNFREAGLSEYIDARLDDAHTLVPQLEGPFDFVFSDADKGWYKNYFTAVDPKLKKGGCFTAHNVSERQSRYRSGQSELLNYVRSLDNYETTVFSSGGGLMISYKK